MTTEHRDNGWQVADSILHRFVDGDLSSEERTAVASLLAGDADALTRAADYQRQTIMLQALHPRRLEDAMLPPAGLNLAAALRRGRLFRRAAAACVGCVALVGAGAAGWQAQLMMRPMAPTAPIVAVFPTAPMQPSTAVTAGPVASIPPVSAALGALGREVPMPSIPAHDEARVPVHPPNLQAIGYQLVDGRADFTAYGPVIRFAYEPVGGAEGERLALMVAAFGADRQSLATSINPQHTSLFWHSGPLLYALSGNVDATRLFAVADVVVGAGERSQPTLEPQAPTAPAVVAPAPEPAVEKPADAPPMGVQPAVETTERPKDT